MDSLTTGTVLSTTGVTAEFVKLCRSAIIANAVTAIGRLAIAGKLSVADRVPPLTPSAPSATRNVPVNAALGSR